jgi:hypothetical protein
MQPGVTPTRLYDFDLREYDLDVPGRTWNTSKVLSKIGTTMSVATND